MFGKHHPKPGPRPHPPGEHVTHEQLIEALRHERRLERSDIRELAERVSYLEAAVEQLQADMAELTERVQTLEMLIS